ncbi:MAG TPA: hypothetical protein VK324_12245, partial [Tepidisphaeraceae bacterium]|nr:hypothetical protein [Tepidisphaeraceae bacterium]
MDLFKQQVARVQQQLGGLNASQKMLAFALVVIMVMTLLYWGRYAGNQEMAPLLNQAFAEEDIARITAELQSRGINARVDGDKIVVPADRKMECIAILGYEQLLPRDTRKGFDEMVKQINPFEANGMVEAKLNQGKAITLSQVIGRFPGVREATVVIDPTTERRIGNGDIRPSAMIHASLRGGKRPDQRLIDAMAAVVTGAQSSIGKITIVIDGRSYKPTADEGEDGGSIPSGEMLERVQAAEARLTRKILEYINW